MERPAFRGVLFDLDGVLRNTEPFHSAAYFRIARDLAGEREVERDVAGRSNLELYGALVERFGGADTAEELSRRHFEWVYRLLTEGNVGGMDGLAALLEGLSRRAVPYGVVSSSCRWFVERNLEDLGMRRRAVCIVTGDDGLALKPAPEMYLAGIAAMGIPAEGLLAVEDSYSGLTAAHRAGLRCAAFYNPDSGPQDMSRAEFHITKLPQVLTVLDGCAGPERV